MYTSGGGKSNVVRLLIGLIRLDQGRLFFKGPKSGSL
jgi:ABC-type iron transport system FetAB ATPase subunit